MAEISNIGSGNFNENYEKGMKFAETSLKDVGTRKRNSIILAFEEVFVNVLKYNDNKDLRISVGIWKENDAVFVKIEDNGCKFNPLLNEDPDVSLDADERELGGLGVFLLKEISDTVNYKYCEGKNILTFGVKINGDN